MGLREAQAELKDRNHRLGEEEGLLWKGSGKGIISKGNSIFSFEVGIE